MDKPSEGRVFVRGLVSDKYTLEEHRLAQLGAPRVRGDEVIVDDASVAHTGDSKDTRTWWRIGPGDAPFLTQNLQIHFVEIPPGKANAGHGHQNEAAFYILEGRGYDIHDDQRHEWEQGDVLVVHTDSVHQHFNDGAETAKALVMKAKSTWMCFGLLQQGRRGPIRDEESFGPRVEWSQLWTEGVRKLEKVLKADDAEWNVTPDGRIRHRLSEDDDARCFSIDLYEQEIEPGGRSGRHWHMADEVLYVLDGSGYSLHWEVQAEIAERYYARIANEPTRWNFTAGDTVYVPQNTVHQHFNASDGPLTLLSVQNRLIRQLGYDSVTYLEPASVWDGVLQ